MLVLIACVALVVLSKPRVQPVNELAVLPVCLIHSVPIHRAPSVANFTVLTTGIVVTSASMAALNVVCARFAAVRRSAFVALPLGYIAIATS